MWTINGSGQRYAGYGDDDAVVRATKMSDAGPEEVSPEEQHEFAAAIYDAARIFALAAPD